MLRPSLRSRYVAAAVPAAAVLFASGLPARDQQSTIDSPNPSGVLRTYMLDGNTVEVPMEQAAFAENAVRYQASLMFINRKIASIESAITGN